VSVFTEEPCKKKKRYRSEEAAQKALAMMRRRAGRGGGWAKKFVVKPQCDACGGFHVGKPEPEAVA
jgi:hypothetical protein